MKNYLKPGKYNPSVNNFIYYEKNSNVFWADLDKDNIEVYYGKSSGGGEYYDLPLKSETELLKILELLGENTRALVSYVIKNKLNN